MTDDTDSTDDTPDLPETPDGDDSDLTGPPAESHESSDDQSETGGFQFGSTDTDSDSDATDTPEATPDDNAAPVIEAPTTGNPAATFDSEEPQEQQNSGVIEVVAEALTRVKQTFEGDDSPTSFEQVAFRHFAGRVRDRRERFAAYRKIINQARYDDTYDRYLAKVALWGCLLGAVGAVIGIITGIAIVQFGLLAGVTEGLSVSSPVTVPAPLLELWGVIKTPLGILTAALVSAVLFAGPTMAVLYYLPYMEAYNREREIEALLPQALTFMYALSQGQMTFPQIVRRLADADESYGEVSRTFQSVVNNMDYFGADLRTALRETRANTPSDELGSLLDDMISIIDSGGAVTPFLADKVEEYQTKAEDNAENELDTMEFVAEMYVTTGVVAILLSIVVLVIIASIQGGGFTALYAIAFGGIPLLSMGFIVMIDTLSNDDMGVTPTINPGNERLSMDAVESRIAGDRGPLGHDPGAGVYGHPDERHARAAVADGGYGSPTGTVPMLERDRQALEQYHNRREREEIIKTLKSPLARMREEPLLTAAVTVPVALLGVLGLTLSGIITPTLTGFIDYPIWTTVIAVILPLVFILTPISYFYERNIRYQRRINAQLPSTLNKLASANETGMTLQDSITLVADSSEDKLSRELANVQKELRWNVSLNNALGRMSRRVQNPRLARVVGLLREASTASGNVREVLRVTARDTKKAHEIDQKRFRTLIFYIAITVFGNLVFLVVSWQLTVKLIPPLAEASGVGGRSSPFGSGFNPDELRFILFQSAVMLSLFSGLVTGKIGAGDTLSGIKFSIAQLLLTAGVFLLT